MKQPVNIVFFGSFLHYSTYVLKELLETDIVQVVGVVTTPPLVDKKGEHKNPVHILAEAHDVPVFTPEKLTDDILKDIGYSILNTGDGQQPNTTISASTNIQYPVSSLNKSIDLFITAGYGKLLPESWLNAPKIAALNLHLSLLPQYRGANPGEWALLMGEKESGVTLIEMSPRFDTGNMIATHRVSIEPTDTRETLYEKLYSQGAQIVPSVLRTYLEFKHDPHTIATELQQENNNATQLHLPPIVQPKAGLYARRLNREDGFIAWGALNSAMNGQEVPDELAPHLYTEIVSSIDYQLSITTYIERATRALAGFPSLWTEIQTKNGPTRMKILEVSISQGKLVLEKVHIAGKQTARWNEVKNVLV